MVMSTQCNKAQCIGERVQSTGTGTTWRGTRSYFVKKMIVITSFVVPLCSEAVVAVSILQRNDTMRSFTHISVVQCLSFIKSAISWRF